MDQLLAGANLNDNTASRSPTTGSGFLGRLIGANGATATPPRTVEQVNYAIAYATWALTKPDQAEAAILRLIGLLQDVPSLRIDAAPAFDGTCAI